MFHIKSCNAEKRSVFLTIGWVFLAGKFIKAKCIFCLASRLPDRKPVWFPAAVWPVPRGLLGSRSWGHPTPDPRPGDTASSQLSPGPSFRLFSVSQSNFLPGLPSSCGCLSQEA